ncbi:MAG: hypothetical protein H8E45_09540 [Proteobacteria bacterium]|nr:hypothetical protein [Pseudomonadota bacterium]
MVSSTEGGCHRAAGANDLCLTVITSSRRVAAAGKWRVERVREHTVPARLAIEQCDDGNSANGDCCSASCGFEAGACDDGDPCTHTDVCVNGSCRGVPVACLNPGACELGPGLCTGDPADLCRYLPALGRVCDDGDECTGNDRCDSSATCRGQAVADDTACSSGVCCDGSCTDAAACPCANLSLPPLVECVKGELCSVELSLSSPDLAVAAISGRLQTDAPATCTGDCLSTPSALCSMNAATCSFSLADIDPPISPFVDGGVAALGLACESGSETESICLEEFLAGSPSGIPVRTCEPACTQLECAECRPADCNGSGRVDAGDPVCGALCLVGEAPLAADCVCAADCNCVGGLEASDPICTMLRLVGALPVDPCEDLPAALVFDDLGEPDRALARMTEELRKLKRSGKREKIVLSLDGSRADQLAAVRMALSASARIKKIKLTRRSRLAGLTLTGSVEHRHGIALVMLPALPSDEGIGAGRLLKVIVRAGSGLEVSDTQYGGLDGLPLH